MEARNKAEQKAEEEKHHLEELQRIAVRVSYYSVTRPNVLVNTWPLFLLLVNDIHFC